jgi:hypothetical protein
MYNNHFVFKLRVHPDKHDERRKEGRTLSEKAGMRSLARITRICGLGDPYRASSPKPCILTLYYSTRGDAGRDAPAHGSDLGERTRVRKNVSARTCIPAITRHMRLEDHLVLWKTDLTYTRRIRAHLLRGKKERGIRELPRNEDQEL